MSARKRSGSGSKRPKEKVVFIYELLLRGENPAQSNPEFWNEFFLLQPNVDSLETEFAKLSGDQLLAVRENIGIVFGQCIQMLDEDHPKRVTHALQTLCALFYAMFKKQATDVGVDVIGTLFGFEEIEANMKRLMAQCNALLISDVIETQRFMCLKLLLVLVTGTNNVSQNTLLEYIMTGSLFDAFVRLLSDSTLRAQHGHDVVILLTLLVNYRKHETANPYVVQLSILADELALNGYGQMISSALIEFGRQYTQNIAEIQPSSWFASLSSIVGNMFVSDEGCERVQQIRANNALLLALYEAVHLNRNFITTLAHTQAESSAPPSPSNTLSANQPVPDANAVAVLDVTQQYPTNLLVAVFQYCSIVMQDNKNESSAANMKLCFLILTCIVEDQYANSMMHDGNLTFKVLLQRAQMRHRKLPLERLSKSQPLAATLLDLLVEFTVSHLMKKFPMELYLLCTGIVHRVLCYQKRCRVRLVYPWKELWSAQISLLKFLVAQEQQLVKKCNIFYLALQIVNIFNLFITYGDTFLATTNSYDELYYELNREEKVFTEIHAMVLRYSQMPDCEFKDDVSRLMTALVNILAIVKHFQNKIKEWLAVQGLSTPSEEQVLEVVRKNYDLTLKLQDSLDHYERYAERPKHTAFFSNLVREVVIDTRKNIYYCIKETHSVPQDYLVQSPPTPTTPIGPAPSLLAISGSIQTTSVAAAAAAAAAIPPTPIATVTTINAANATVVVTAGTEQRIGATAAL